MVTLFTISLATCPAASNALTVVSKPSVTRRRSSSSVRRARGVEDDEELAAVGVRTSYYAATVPAVNSFDGGLVGEGTRSAAVGAGRIATLTTKPGTMRWKGSRRKW
jgi:hypothetical protein